MSTMTIDGRDVEFQSGETVLAAARRVGAEIPTLCYDERVSPGGACRLCLVEADGRLVPSCAYPARPGLSVRTRTPEIDRYRHDLLDLTLSEIPPGSCRRCGTEGSCALHGLARRLGADGKRFAGAFAREDAPDPNPLIVRDYSQCIFCDRCTRVCNELEQAHAIAPAGRGFSGRIAAFGERGLEESPCTFCGQCVNTCPTGALLERPRVERPGGGAVSRSVKTTCPYCGTGCSLFLDVAGERVVGVRPDFDSPVNRGSLCVKGQFGWEFVHDPERLTTPLIREENGFRKAGWDEALDLVARRLGGIKAADGPDAVVFWSSARATSESNYLFQKLARAAVGTNNIDNCART